MAEFGVILLMFGVGLHYDVADLWQVKRVVIPGAVIQIAIVAAAGFGLGHAWGLSTGGAWIFGIAVSVASTVVLMRSLMDHGWLDSPAGKVAIGWLGGRGPRDGRDSRPGAGVGGALGVGSVDHGRHRDW
jgi:CPA2 family monovalent cation:H+ antiporter-2